MSPVDEVFKKYERIEALERALADLNMRIAKVEAKLAESDSQWYPPVVRIPHKGEIR